MRETDCLAMKLLDHTCCSILTEVCLVAIKFRRTAEMLGAELKILGAQLQILGAPTRKE